jgi:hypothetical protein
MDVAAEALGGRFLAAFNQIEDQFRQVLGVDEHAGFAWMARQYADRNRLPAAQRDALLAFALLLNAISHGRYYDRRPIAEPVPEVVVEIEQLRDQVTCPPLAMAVLGSRKVCLTRPGDQVGTVLEYVERFDYSQIPVYDGGRYVGILTTNAIARWLAHQLTRNQGLAEGEPVSRVLAFAEPYERARLVGRAITAADALDEAVGAENLIHRHATR